MQGTLRCRKAQPCTAAQVLPVKYILPRLYRLCAFYMQFENTIFYAPTFLSKSWYFDNLDSIGSIGMNLCELYRIKKNDKILNLINVLMSALEKNIPRFEDGTFYRHPVCSYDGTKKQVMVAKIIAINKTKFFLIKLINVVFIIISPKPL